MRKFAHSRGFLSFEITNIARKRMIESGVGTQKERKAVLLFHS